MVINIKNKIDCCGCGACQQICPKECIVMQSDSEGFLYPCVNNDSCINCNLCEKVCAILHKPAALNSAPLAYAAKNCNEEIREKSSSGGIFTLLAEKVIAEKGVVFGAKLDEQMKVIHSYSETIEGLADFRGSKYVQSVIGDNFKKVKEFLNNGRLVLFSGTPCQINGLRNFLQHDYENLLLVDIICHGVPSPLVWEKYKEELEQKFGKVLESFSFRNKNSGWKNYSYQGKTSQMDFSILATTSAYSNAFISDISTRSSCSNCPSKHPYKYADITLGDFWGVEKVLPEIDDDKGISLVLLNSEKGTAAFNGLKDFINQKCDFQKAISGNQSLVKSSYQHKNRELFFEQISVKSCTELFNKFGKESLKNRLLNKFKRVLHKLKIIPLIKKIVGLKND